MAKKRPKYLASVGRLLGFASKASSKLSDRRLREYDLTVQQWIPLTALWRNSPLPESELAAYCRMSASSLNRLLDRMEDKRLIRRAKDKDDLRRNLVHLGSKGKKLSHLLDFYRDINGVMLKGMTAKESETLVKLLEKLVRNLEEELES